MEILLGLILAIASTFLILLVLVQRGRGGGLTGALGGPGGQSAFGAKAGDIFTYITIWTVSIWILLCMSALWWVGCQDKSPLSESLGSDVPSTSQPQNQTGVLSTEELLKQLQGQGAAPAGTPATDYSTPASGASGTGSQPAAPPEAAPSSTQPASGAPAPETGGAAPAAPTP